MARFRLLDEATTVQEPPAEGKFRLLEDSPTTTVKDQVFNVFDEGFKKAKGVIPDVDLGTGVQDFGFRAAFSRMDTPEERRNFLTQKFGPGGFVEAPNGSFLLTPDSMNKMGLESPTGNPVLIDEILPTKYDVADFAGDAPEILGSVGGGMRASGSGFIPGMVASGAGAMIGKGLDELVEEQQGLNLQSKGEVSKDILTSGAVGAAGEGTVRALRPIGRKILGPNTTRPFTPTGKQGPVESTVDPRRLELIDKAHDIGATPSILQASDSPLSGRTQGMMDTVFGDPRARGNAQALLKERGRLIKDAGGGQNFSEKEAVDAVGERLGLNKQNLERTVEQASLDVDRQVKESIRRIQKQVGPNGGNAGVELTETIRVAKSDFSSQATHLYSKVDQLVGNEKLIGTEKIKAAAKDILERFPDSGEGKAFIDPKSRQFLNSIVNMEENISFAQAQNVRARLSDAAFNPNLLKDIGNFNALNLKHSVQGAIDTASLGNSVQAAKALEKATRFYDLNIKKFDDVFIERITRDLSQRGSVQPEHIVQAVMATKSPTKIAKVRRLAGTGVWASVQRDAFDLMLKGSRTIDDEISSVKLFNKIESMQNGYWAIFGQKNGTTIKNLAKELAARGGKVDPATLEQSGLKEALVKSLNAKKQLDTFMQTNFIKSLQTGGKNFDDAIDFLVAPSRARQVAEARKILGASSQEWQKVKQATMRKMLNTVVDNTADPVRSVLQGKQLAKEVDRHRSMLHQMFGAKGFKEIEDFADVAFLLTNKKNLSGGMVAANIALHPMRNLGKLVQLNVFAKMLSTPGAVNFFTRGLKAKGLRQGSDVAVRAAAQSMSQTMSSFLQDLGPAFLGMKESFEVGR